MAFPEHRPDLIVVGGGLIGLAVTAAAAERGLFVTLLTTARPGAASRAAAGLLVPHYSGEGTSDKIARFLIAARDAYPAYVRWVDKRSGLRVPFQTAGAIEVARSATECTALHDAAPYGAVRLTSRDVADLEPSLAPVAGGLLHPGDGAVDNICLTDALTGIVQSDSRVRVVSDAAMRIDVESHSPTVVTASGLKVHGPHVVVAAGAWAASIDGLPRPLPVRPLRGQICCVDTAPLRHVVISADVYMVTRGADQTLIGSTMEEVGFDAGTTSEAIQRLRQRAVAMCPRFEPRPIVDAWSGLRPATPDLLPVLGPDPDYPALLYACGHSRNGILLAPITGAVIASIAAGDDPSWDVSPFSIDRFRPAGATA